MGSSSKAELEETHYIKSSRGKYRQPKAENAERKRKATRVPEQRFNNKVELKCVHCGGANHEFAKCKCRNYKCKICRKEGHLAKVCRNRDRPTTNSYYRKSEEKKKGTGVDIIDLWKFENNELVDNPVVINVEIERQSIPMEIDTGAGKSIIPEKIFLKKFSHCRLEEIKVRLRMYDGTTLIPEGQIRVKIKNKESKVQIYLIVVKKGNKSLMGRDLMKLLNIKITSVHSVEENGSLGKLLEEFKDLFTDELGRNKYKRK